MKNSTRITLIAIIIILMLLVVGSTIFLYVQKYAYADTQITDSEGFVNFNQQVTNDYINFTCSDGQTLPISFYSGKLYIRINTTARAIMRLNYASTYYTIDLNSGYNDLVFNCQYNITNITMPLYDNQSTITNFNIINLTQMFGENEPDIDQCRELFLANYYYYTSGTPISLNGLNSYAQGVWDTIGAQKVQYNNNIISSLAFAYSTGTISSTFAYDTSLGVYAVDGILGVPVGSIPNDSQITTYTTFWLPNYDGSLYYMTMYKQDGNLVVADISPIIAGTNENYVRTSFSIPLTIDTLYFALSSNGSSINPNVTMYVFNTDLEFISTDIQAITYSAYERGASYYKTYYSEGNEGYNEIFNAGKQYAITHNTNNAWGSAWDFIESAFTGIGSIFAIELLPNVPLSVFILVPLMISLIFFVVKLVKGGD